MESENLAIQLFHYESLDDSRFNYAAICKESISRFYFRHNLRGWLWIICFPESRTTRSHVTLQQTYQHWDGKAVYNIPMLQVTIGSLRVSARVAYHVESGDFPWIAEETATKPAK
jgi:hypothetical protein